MRTLLFFLFAAVGFVVASAIVGAVILKQRPPFPPHPVSVSGGLPPWAPIGTPPEEEERGSPSSSGASPTAAATEARTIPSAGSEHCDPVDPAVVRSLIESAVLPELTPVEETITGEILDANGTPVPGVRVRAFPGVTLRRSQLDAQGLATEIVRRHHIEQEWTREAVSDENGRFRIESLLDLKYRVTFVREGWTIGNRRSVLPRWGYGYSRVAPGTELLLRAAEQFELTVDVRGTDGAVVDRATVSVRRYSPVGQGRGIEPAGRSSDWTPENNTVKVAGVGVVRLVASTPEARSVPVTITVASGKKPDPIVLRLPERHAVRVEIVLPPGESATPWLHGSMRRIHPLAPSEVVGDPRTCAGLNSRLFFPAGPPGLYRLDVGRTRGVVDASWVIEVTQDLQDVRLLMPPMPPVAIAKGVVFRVVDPGGALIADSRFTIEVRKRGGKRTHGPSVVRTAEGNYMLYGDALDRGLADARVGAEAMLRVRAPGFISRGLQLPSEKGSVTRVVLDPTGETSEEYTRIRKKRR